MSSGVAQFSGRGHVVCAWAHAKCPAVSVLAAGVRPLMLRPSMHPLQQSTPILLPWGKRMAEEGQRIASHAALPPLGIGWGLVLPFIAVPLAVIFSVAVMCLYAVYDAAKKTERPKVYTTPSEFNVWVLDRCSVLCEPYRPTPFLSEGHCEAVFANRYTGCPKLTYERECLLMEDGGIIALDWEQDDSLPSSAPLLLLLPGLTQGSEDTYVCWAVEWARRHGIRAVVFNSRGCSNSPVTTPKLYSACFTGDLRAVVKHVHEKHPDLILMAAGWSMGANILVRYLGQMGESTPIMAAVSLCNPFNLTITRTYFNTTFSKIYNWGLAVAFKTILAKHENVWNSAKGKVELEKARACTTLDEFDAAITIKSFDWVSVEEYYEQSSSWLSIPHVKIPLLCIQALNDPVSIKDSIPYKELSENPNCTLITTKTGGHLGWFAGEGAPWGPRWTDRAVMQWLTSVMQEWNAPGGASDCVKQVLDERRAAAAAAAAAVTAAAAAEPPTSKEVAYSMFRF